MLQTLSSHHACNFQNPECWQLPNLQPGSSGVISPPYQALPPGNSFLPAGQSLIIILRYTPPHLTQAHTNSTSPFPQQWPCLDSDLSPLAKWPLSHLPHHHQRLRKHQHHKKRTRQRLDCLAEARRAVGRHHLLRKLPRGRSL